MCCLFSTSSVLRPSVSRIYEALSKIAKNSDVRINSRKRSVSSRRRSHLNPLTPTYTSAAPNFTIVRPIRPLLSRIFSNPPSLHPTIERSFYIPWAFCTTTSNTQHLWISSTHTLTKQGGRRDSLQAFSFKNGLAGFFRCI